MVTSNDPPQKVSGGIVSPVAISVVPSASVQVTDWASPSGMDSSRSGVTSSGKNPRFATMNEHVTVSPIVYGSFSGAFGQSFAARHQSVAALGRLAAKAVASSATTSRARARVAETVER